MQDTGELHIRPITLLVGPNSSGKSSLLQILLMLRQTIESTDINNPLAANDGWIKAGSYPDFIFKGEHDRNLEVNLELTSPFPVMLEKKDKPRHAKMSLRLVFSYNSSTTQIELEEREARFRNFIEKVTRTPKKREFSVEYNVVEKGKKDRWKRRNVKQIKFHDTIIPFKSPEEWKEIRKSYPAMDVFWGFGAIIESEIRDIYYLGPLRESPERFYVTSGHAPRDVGVRGERAVDALWFSHRSKQDRMRSTVKKVRYWFKKFAFGRDIALDRLRGNFYRVVITDSSTGIEVNIADIGFGASQTIPIIIESFYSTEDSLIMIEQPEIHLHPKAQSILGDLFIEASKDSQRSFLVETHSEHLLARIRRRIAEGVIDKDNVAIYYFEPTSDGTVINEITLNDKGQYETFPKGFFEEDIIEAFEHLKAINKKK